MGPYCNYCNRRCFAHWPLNTPRHIMDAYDTAIGRHINILATCHAGQAHEKERTGFCYNDILAAIATKEANAEV